MIVLVVSAAITAAIVGLALALPCPACRRRRERLEAAYAAWRNRRLTK